MRESTEGESVPSAGLAHHDEGRICQANPNLLATSVLVDELLRNGVRDVCISPGSRSAPLTLAFARRSEMRKHVHVDERCAAFFALGLARASRRPVVLVCTSGSAAANYHPAIMEAFETGVPLIVLGADRPRRLVDSGANQTTVQDGLFGPHVLRSETFDLPRAEAPWLRWLRGRICRLVELAGGPRSGPVHVNLPFDEPLSAVVVPGSVPIGLQEDDPASLFGRADGAPFSRTLPGVMGPSPEQLDRLESAFERGPGLIVVGPMDAPSALARALVALADRLQAPVLADPLSGLRGCSGVVGAADAILRGPAARSLQPAWVLSFGRVPVSKALFRFLGELPAGAMFHVDHSGRHDDPEHGGPTFLRCDPEALAAALEQRGASVGSADAGGFRTRWMAAERAAADSLEASVEAGGFLEGQVVRTVLAALPDEGILWVASSMPVREVDTFQAAGSSSARVLASRGVSGIDGLVSSTFGAEAAGVGPTVGLLGDLATLHDVGGLAAVRRLGAGATLVVINNGGGGIFEHLPLAGTDAPVDAYFVAEHQQTFDGIAAAFGLGYARPTNAQDLQEALARAAEDSGAWLIEVPIDRAASLAWHRATWTAAADAASVAVS
jgi:2-succinyl-5-enolpyruvyl-6-hydroxy-3-cyclohexene-1-carboxylate synthase